MSKKRKKRAPIAVKMLLTVLMMALLLSGSAAADGPQTESADPAVQSGYGYLNGKSIGVQTGTNFDVMVEDKLPDAVLEYYNSKTDLVAALTGRKIDAFVTDEPVAKLLIQENDQLTYIPEYLDYFDFAFIFPMDEDGEALRDQFNAFLEPLRSDGTLEALAEEWFGDDESRKTMIDVDALSAENGTLRVATDPGYAPFEYVRDGAPVGYDMKLAAMFCQAYGYGLDIVTVNFDSILPSISAGKCDFAASGISITPERARSVLFSNPNYSGGTVLMVLKNSTLNTEDGAAAADSQGSRQTDQKKDGTFFDGIINSFQRTFLHESRWKLFREGIVTTLVITLLSLLFGTLLGFLIFMLCRKGNRVANLITRFCLWLVQGTPMVVLLMILYYIVFGSVAISGITVAVIGFTLTFASSVFGLLKIGVGAVDDGQYEAASALGYSDRRTFYKIILPQALPHVLPSYKGEIVGLIKSTSIVGYIAVLDLTKMGDIVRSRTYEAFFPLIAVTVIYFILEGLIGLAVARVSIRFNPKRRKPAQILKGVRRHD